ncbi:MAG: hypothetical protein LUC88_01910, partial [Prevotella sp.]|nr:hypothetical protein [Prevotella sp.]
GTTVSCKDYEEDMYSDMQGQLTAQTAALESALATLQAQQEYLQSLQETQGDEIDGLKTALSTAEETLGNMISSITTLQGQVAGIQGDVDNIKSTLNGVDIAGMWSVYNQLIQYAGSADNYVAMQDALMDFIKEYQSCGSTITQIVEDVAAAKTAADVNSGLIENLGDSVSALKDEIAQQKTEAEEEYTNIWQAINGILDGGSGTDYSELITILTQTLTDHETRISKLETTLSEQVLKLNNLESCLSQLVTGILIQATQNPIYGTFSLPVGVQSNVLAAYYGSIEDDVEFPTTRNGNYVGGENYNLTAADLQMLGVTSETYGGALISDQEGNAGTLYVTINPNTVDYTGLTIGLENSQGKASGVELGTLTPSNHLISFGYTRSVENGFYEAKATVSKDVTSDIKPDIDINGLRSVISQLKNYVTSLGSESLNVTDIVTTLYSECSNILDANAVYAKWTDDNGVEHKTYSNYELAATAIKPLSYGFLYDQTYSNFPGIGRLESMVNKVFNKITIPSFNLDDYDFSKIENIQYTDQDKITADVTIHVNAGEVVSDTVHVYDNDGNLIGSGVVANGEVDITATVDITDVLNDFMADEYGQINDVIDNINSYLDNVNAILEAVSQINQLADNLDDMQSKIISYLDKINNRLCNILNSANKLLQPILLVGTTDGYAQISQIQVQPSLLSGTEATLVPTSFTAETVAPAYKKLVGVTNVYSSQDVSISAQNGDSGCLSALQNANSSADMATILDGNTQFVTLSGLQKGYIYEIAYTAVDYSGVVVAEKYYVKVAE